MLDPSLQTPAATATEDLDPAPDAREVEQASADLVEEDLLVEDVSIDGMCGVY
jgi:mycofactocin precursor